MKNMILSLFVLTGLVRSLEAKEFINVENCVRTGEEEDVLRASEFSWGMTLDEILQKEKDVYEKGFRLKARAYYEDGEVYLPYQVYGDKEEKKIKLTDRFMKSVIGHVEGALKRGYVDAVIFPDMGHSHFFLDQKYYDEVLSSIPVKEGHKRYELMLAHPETRFLYHTAEQLTMVDENKQLLPDRKIQWRFFTRNLVGGNKNLGKLELLHNETHSHNTSHTYEEGYRYWGAGFDLSATKNGCFAYKKNGKTYYFDLSLKSLE